MGRVKVFDISSNYVRVLPASMANMTELTALNLSSNKLCVPFECFPACDFLLDAANPK
jgi:hypothetical protein